LLAGTLAVHDVNIVEARPPPWRKCRIFSDDFTIIVIGDFRRLQRAEQRRRALLSSVSSRRWARRRSGLMRRVIHILLLASLCGGSGCALRAEGADDDSVTAKGEAFSLVDVGDLSGSVVAQPEVSPPATPTATLVVYSEAGFYGDTLVQSATPATNNEAVNLIRTAQIQAANLLGRSSSFRLVCGTRDAEVVLFKDINNGTTLHDWSEFSVGRVFTCKANETRSVNLHQEAPELADNVGSIYLVSHARKAFQAGFAAFVRSNWNQSLGSLSDGASADGGAQLRLDGQNSFVLRQFLDVDAWECEGRGAIFGLRAIMNQDRTFTVSVIEVYVDTGWGDSWGCRDGMTAGVRSAAVGAAAKLADALHNLSALAGAHPHYYFVLGETMRDFDLVGGGDRFLVPLDDVPVAPVKGAR
jgi:hypothetical protein